MRDVSPEVRLHALGMLRDKVEMRWLSISQRVSLIEGALLDRTPAVKAPGPDVRVMSAPPRQYTPMWPS